MRGALYRRSLGLFDSEPTHPVEQQREGWQHILHHLERHVEAGGRWAGAA